MSRAIATGARVALHRPTARDADDLIAAARRSRRLHGPWVQAPDTPEAVAAYLRRIRPATHEGFLVRRTSDDALVGVINLSEIVRGAFSSAYLGYHAFTPHARRGYLREGVGLVTVHAFGTMGLHRLNANVRPENVASVALLRNAGFRVEGSAPRYLHLDGAWRDHRPWVLLADGQPEDEVLARAGTVTLHRVTSANWREVAAVRARRDQGRWIGPVERYLVRCAYGGDWSPLAIRAGGTVVGFAMWGRDPEDGSYWIGGFQVDKKQQRRGYGRDALAALIAYLRSMPGCRQVALTFEPDNAVARALYLRAGFVETGEIEDDEVVARLDVRPRRRT
jgi:ribosomal-protein-alanine N-acetyltransferase